MIDKLHFAIKKMDALIEGGWQYYWPADWDPQGKCGCLGGVYTGSDKYDMELSTAALILHHEKKIPFDDWPGIKAALLERYPL